MAENPPIANEQTWIVNEIVRDLAEVIFFGSKPEAPSDQLRVHLANIASRSPTFRISIEAPSLHLERSFELKHHIWSAETYAPIAAEMLANLKSGDSKRQPPDPALLKALTDGKTTTIIRNSRRVSDQLAERPLDPDLHEQAALLIGALALREATGDFADTRGLLCRMATHLSLARALRPAEGDAGRLARIITLCLVDREAEALEVIKALGPEQSRWANALKLRATSDWRSLKNPEKSSALEQMELFRALRVTGLDSRALSLLKEIGARSEPEWSRVAIGGHFSVQEGHAFASASVPLEIIATVADWGAFTTAELKDEQIVEVLNRPATRCVSRTIEGRAQLEVLGWGQLAAFHQRQLAQAIEKTFSFLDAQLGVPEDAHAFRKQIAKQSERMHLLFGATFCLASEAAPMIRF